MNNSGVSKDPSLPLFPTAPHLALRQDDARVPWGEPKATWDLPPWAKSMGLLPILPGSKDETKQWAPAYDRQTEDEQSRMPTPALLPDSLVVDEVVDEIAKDSTDASEARKKKVKKRVEREKDAGEVDDTAYAAEESEQWAEAVQGGRGKQFPSARQDGTGKAVSVSGEQKLISRVLKWWLRFRVD